MSDKTKRSAAAVSGETSTRAAASASHNEGQLPGYWSPTDPQRPPIDGPIGQDLWKRADKVMPSKAMFLTRSSRFAGYNVLPGFIAEAEGCRIKDVDGRCYIDFSCSNGPSLLGYRHPEIEAVAAAQTAKGDGVPFFSPAMIELCERLLVWSDGFGWVNPVKRGSDATELAMRVARVHTRRPNVVMFKLSYHGSNKEQSIFFEGTPSDGTQHAPRLAWNDVAALDEFPSDQGAQVAAILMSPLDQNSGVPCVFPTAEFIAAIHRFRERTGALIILDDVRAGFRLHPKGSQHAIGLEPDLMCLGKALGNGYTQAALLGKELLRSSVEQILYTSTTIFSAVCARAAIATIDIYEQIGAFEKMTRAGQRLIAGIQAAAGRQGRSIGFSGPPTHPTMLFEDDPGLAKAESFSHNAAMLGACFHTREPWFLSAAHDDAAIDEAIEIAGEAFARMDAR
jgi:glutamate-1-semialdehyde 2,1-aminomutase